MCGCVNACDILFKLDFFEDARYVNVSFVKRDDFLFSGHDNLET